MADDIDRLIKYFEGLPENEKTGPASEKTLKDLLNHFQGRSPKGRQEKKDAEETSKSNKKSAKEILTITQRLREYEADKFKENRVFYSLFTGAKMFGNQLLEGRASLTGFGNTVVEMADLIGNKYLFGLAKSFQVLSKIVDQQIDNFKQLSEIGIQFSDGLFTTREQALRAGISLDAFSSAIGSSADTLALLGGSVRGGTERFASISKLLQGQFRSSANGLGMTFEETTGYLTDYLEIQTLIGQAQTMTNKQLNAGAQDFILNLDQLSAITGKQRKQIADAVKQDMMEKRIQGIMQSLESSMVPGVQEILGSLQGLPQQTQDAFKELIGTGGVPISDFAKSLVRLNPNISTFAKQVSLGNGSVEGFEAIIRQTAQRSQNLGSGFQRQGALLDVLGNQTLAANVELFRFTKFGAQRNQVEAQQQKAIKDISNQIIGFKDALKDVTNALMYILMPFLKGLAIVLGFVSKSLNSLFGSIQESDSALKQLGAGAGTLVLGFGALYTVTKLMTGSFKLLSGLFSRMLPTFGGGGAAVAGTKALSAAGPGVAKGGAFAGLGIGALLGLSGAGAGLGIAAIGKGLQTFNNVDGKNLSDVASATKDLIAALVSGVANPVDLATAVSGMKTYAKSMSEALDDLDKDKLSLYTTKLEELAGAFREVNTSMSGAITTSGRTNQDKLDGISTLLAEIKLVMEDVANSNKNISRKTSNSNVYNT